MQPSGTPDTFLDMDIETIMQQKRNPAFFSFSNTSVWHWFSPSFKQLVNTPDIKQLISIEFNYRSCIILISGTRNPVWTTQFKPNVLFEKKKKKIWY